MLLCGVEAERHRGALPDLVRPSSGMGARGLVAALSAYTAIRATGLLVLAVWSSVKGKDAGKLLSGRWDSLWYERVAEHGYDVVIVAPDGRKLSDMAFFPLFPWLEKSVSGITGIPCAMSGLLVSALASLAAAAGIFAVVRRCQGDDAAVLTVALWAALPVGIVQSMAYSESLFMAVAAWSLYFALDEKWILAGLLASAAGLTRPIGLASACAVVVAAVETARRSGSSARLMAGAVLAPLGGASYTLWVSAQKGSLFGYFDVQAEWGNGLDGGVAFAGFVADLLFSRSFLAGAGLAVAVAVLLRAYVLGFRGKYPLPLQVYTGIVMALALCTSSYFGSKPRLLMPAFGVLVPTASRLSRLSPLACTSVLAVVSLLSAAYGAFWLNGSGPP